MGQRMERHDVVVHQHRTPRHPLPLLLPVTLTFMFFLFWSTLTRKKKCGQDCGVVLGAVRHVGGVCGGDDCNQHCGISLGLAHFGTHYDCLVSSFFLCVGLGNFQRANSQHGLVIAGEHSQLELCSPQYELLCRNCRLGIWRIRLVGINSRRGFKSCAFFSNCLIFFFQ